MITTDELKAIRERCEKATEGTWVYIDRLDQIWAVHEQDEDGGSPIFDVGDMSVEDIEFIAHAKTDIPRLLDEVERLKTYLYATLNIASNCDNDGIIELLVDALNGHDILERYEIDVQGGMKILQQFNSEE